MPMQRELEVAFDSKTKTWGLRWKYGDDFYETGFRTRDDAGAWLWENFDDCD